jgi:hypothetical protein
MMRTTTGPHDSRLFDDVIVAARSGSPQRTALGAVPVSGAGRPLSQNCLFGLADVGGQLQS